MTQAIYSRDPRDLHPSARAKWDAFDAAMSAAGIDFLTICTFRNDVAQLELFNIGRGAGDLRRHVTNARPGESAHNVTQIEGGLIIPAACAFDAAPIEHGKIDWDSRNPLWARMGAIGRSVGLEWAGDWATFREYPHFQLFNWRTYK